jgi:hypothetical protein
MKKKPKKEFTYTTYSISIDGIVRYIGTTNNLHRRQLEHNNLFKKGNNKLLYEKMRELKFEGIIELIPMYEFATSLRSKRRECYEILKDYFGPNNLFQKVPNISDL